MPYTNLKLSLGSTIFPNTTKLIDAQTHQDFEEELIDALGALQYQGIVTPASVPGYNDGECFVLALTAGVYANYSGIVLADGDVAFLRFDGIATWTKDLIFNSNSVGLLSSVGDTATVDMDLTAGGVLTANVILDPALNNDITATSGIFLNVQNAPVDDNENLLGGGAGASVPLINLLDELASLATSNPWTKVGTNIYPTTLTDFVGINNNTPTRELDVKGRMNLSIAATGSMFINGGNATATGTGNFVAGVDTGLALTTGFYNFMGISEAGKSLTTGSNNVMIGRYAGFDNVSGQHNINLGYWAGKGATGSYNVMLGQLAGAYETGSSKFYVSTAFPSDEATGRAKALLYGIMSDTTTDQKLYANSELYLPLYGAGSITGTATKLLGVDVTGKVIELDTGGSGGHWITDANGINSDGQNIGVKTTSNASYAANILGWTNIQATADLAMTLRNSSGLETYTFTHNTGAANMYLRDATATAKVLLNANGDSYLNGGNVGINQTIPTQKLHVTGNARVTGAFYDSSNSPGVADYILKSTVTGTSWVAISSLTASSPWTRSGTNVFPTALTDNVGIGTSTPAKKFQVTGTSLMTDALTIGADLTGYVDFGFTVNTANGGIILNRTSALESFVRMSNSTAYGAMLRTRTASASNGFDIATLAGGPFLTLAETRSAFPSGIETKGGNGGTGGALNQIKMGFSGTVATGFAYSQAIKTRHSSGGADNNGIEFWTWTTADGTYGNPSVFCGIFENGKLGVATQDPTQPLHVVGNARITGAYYDSSNSAGTSGFIMSTTGTGTSWVNPSTIAGVWTRSGTNIFPTTLTDNVGINNASPARKLDVRGTMKLDDGLSNTFITGGNTTVTGIENIAIGFNAGVALTTANYNMLLGRGAGQSLQDGATNVFIGGFAGDAAVSADNNIGIGYNSLTNATSDENVAVGKSALQGLTIGQRNTAIGVNANDLNLTGSYNVTIGFYGGRNATGLYNTIVGAFTDGVLANNNTIIGYEAAGAATAGNSNTFIGKWSGYSNAGDNNIFVGEKSGYYETGSNKLYITNQQGSDLADGWAKAIIAGDMSATTENQRLYVNARLGVNMAGVEPSSTVEIRDAATATLRISDATKNWEFSHATGTGHLVLKTSDDKDFEIQDASGTAFAKFSAFNGDFQTYVTQIHNGSTWKNALRKNASSSALQLGSVTLGDWSALYLTHKVGIKTNDPTDNLHIHETTAGANYIHFTNTDTGTLSTDGAFVGISASEVLTLNNKENAGIDFATNNTIQVTIEAGGDVIIYNDIIVNNANNVRIVTGAGSPESVVTAGIGSTYHRTDGSAGTSLYVKESGTGNTGWVAK